MRIPITVPDITANDEPLRLGEWSVDIGNEVEQEECLAELICPGLVVELNAPQAGTVVELVRQPEQLVRPGDIIGWLETST